MEYQAKREYVGKKCYVVVYDDGGNEVGRLGGKRAERANWVIMGKAFKPLGPVPADYVVQIKGECVRVDRPKIQMGQFEYPSRPQYSEVKKRCHEAGGEWFEHRRGSEGRIYKWGVYGAARHTLFRLVPAPDGLRRDRPKDPDAIPVPQEVRQ